MKQATVSIFLTLFLLAAYTAEANFLPGGIPQPPTTTFDCDD